MKRAALAVFFAVFIALAGVLSAQSSNNLQYYKKLIEDYYESGRYEDDVQELIRNAIRYASDHLDATRRNALVLDIGDTSLSNYSFMKSVSFGYCVDALIEYSEEANAPAIQPTLELFNLAKAHGVAVFFITGQFESQRGNTLLNLTRAGYSGWEQVYFKPDGSHFDSVADYKTSRRRQITEQGYHILLSIGDQLSDIEGGYAEKTCKLPNPMYYVR